MSRFCSDEGRSGNTGLHPNHSTSRLILPGPTLLAHIYMHRTCAETDRQNQRQTHSRVSYRRQPSGIGFCCEKILYALLRACSHGYQPLHTGGPSQHASMHEEAVHLQSWCYREDGCEARRQPLPRPQSENFAKCIQQSMTVDRPEQQLDRRCHSRFHPLQLGSDSLGAGTGCTLAR